MMEWPIHSFSSTWRVFAFLPQRLELNKQNHDILKSLEAWLPEVIQV